MTAQGLVYVVDDDESLLRSLGRLISSAGVEVTTFSSAREFLVSGPADDRPCCLVLDLRLPDLSGLDIQTALGERRDTLPIIFLTGYGTVYESVNALKKGAFDFIEKPVDGEYLVATIRRALQWSIDNRAVDADRAAIAERWSTLTPREQEVFDHVVRGMLNKQIAYELEMAEKTVKIHRARVMDKMKANSVADLVRFKLKLTPPDNNNRHR